MPIAALILLLFSSTLFGYESDQYMNRTQNVRDSIHVMNDQVNNAIDQIIARKNQPRTDLAFARAVFNAVGGWYWADKIERWAAKSSDVDKYEQTRHKSIYRSMPFWATRVNFVFGVGRSFRVNDVMVGSDKFGHFFSQGFKYFKRDLRGESFQQIVDKGAFAERWIFGLFTTGVYSNADLVANYEGWLFYQSLFSDNIIAEKSAIVGKVDGRYVKHRSFTWADHINPYWDEALNPSYNVQALNKRLRKSIKTFCPEFERLPSRYTVPQDSELWARYYRIGLRDNRANQFEAICSR